MKNIKPERKTDWKQGDWVRVIKTCFNINHPFEIRAGIEGALIGLERIQDDQEIWIAWFPYPLPCRGRFLGCTTHLNLEKIDK